MENDHLYSGEKCVRRKSKRERGLFGNAMVRPGLYEQVATVYK